MSERRRTTEAKLGESCELHGGLLRKCEACSDREEIARLEAKNARLRDDFRAVQRERDEARVEAARARIAEADARIAWKSLRAKLTRYEEDVDRERYEARAEAERRVVELGAERDLVRRLLEDAGCSCDCEHAYGEHDNTCARCLGCRVAAAIAEDQA